MYMLQNTYNILKKKKKVNNIKAYLNNIRITNSINNNISTINAIKNTPNCKIKLF